MGRLRKAALLCVLSALSVPLGNALPFWSLSGRFDRSLFIAYFLPTLPFPAAQIGNRIVVWLLLTAAVVLFGASLVCKSRDGGRSEAQR